MLELLVNLSTRCLGARPLKYFSVNTESLLYNNCLTGSQLSWRSKWVTWSNFLEFVTILLAKF